MCLGPVVWCLFLANIWYAHCFLVGNPRIQSTSENNMVLLALTHCIFVLELFLLDRSEFLYCLVCSEWLLNVEVLVDMQYVEFLLVQCLKMFHLLTRHVILTEIFV